MINKITVMLMFPGGLILTGWLLVKGIDVTKWNAKAKAARALEAAPES